MTMPPDDPSASQPADDGAVAAAWLAGDLDPAEAARFEARLAADPAVAAQLEAVAETVLRLRAPDAVPLPPGYTTRLRTRMATERAAPPAAGRSATGTGTDAQARRPGTGADGQAGGAGADGQAGRTGTGAGGHAGSTGTGAGAGADGQSRGSGTGGHGGRVGTGAGTDGQAGGRGPEGAAGRRPGSGDPGGAGARPPGRDGAGGRRRRVSTAALSAAALGLVGVLGLAALASRLPGLTGDGGSSTVEVMAEAEDAAPDPPAVALEDSRGAGAAEGAAGEEQGATTSDAARPAPAPVTRGAPLALGDDPAAAAAARFSGDPSAQALLGTPVAEAAALAATNRAAIAAAGPVAGTDPTACLDTALAGAGTAVPVRVEALTADGVPALAHVVAVADPADLTLARVEVRILRADTCASLATAPG